MKKHSIKNGKCIIEECKRHSFRWTGKMPCTGIYACIYCGIEKTKIEKQKSENKN